MGSAILACTYLVGSAILSCIWLEPNTSLLLDWAAVNYFYMDPSDGPSLTSRNWQLCIRFSKCTIVTREREREEHHLHCNAQTMTWGKTLETNSSIYFLHFWYMFAAYNFWAHIWYPFATDLANNRECNVVWGDGWAGREGEVDICHCFSSSLATRLIHPC